MKTIELTDKELRQLRNMLELLHYDTKQVETKSRLDYELVFTYKLGKTAKETLESIREKVWQAQFD